MEQDQSILSTILNEQSQEELAAIKANGKLITLDDITFVRFSLKKSKTLTTVTINASISILGGSFNKLRYNLSQRGRDFYRNLPDDWQLSQSYNNAYDYFNKLTSSTKWIGKAVPKKRFKAGESTMHIAPLNAMVLEVDCIHQQMIYQGKCFIENAEFDFIFDEQNEVDNNEQQRWFRMHSNPISVPQEQPSRGPMIWK